MERELTCTATAASVDDRSLLTEAIGISLNYYITIKHTFFLNTVMDCMSFFSIHNLDTCFLK